MEGSLTANWDVDWSKIHIPILIMTGHYDKVFRIPGDIDEICNTMKNIERVEFPECGHLIPMENPNEFAEKINQFGSNIT
jgi:pimeloyl-ACP methyl ester carboxylesterase